ncbi:hypothetical protein GCM10007382_00530 [Salinibacterium xinjiangense]|uniref:GAF domain-containing protein n=2 Tax=Salinibacterium xinjiangense TaxID=386302 RepID=A0A2C9A399_9MICO|nr:hypothetical protein GCM10007382_00530 [Salinibacterium xinjiangense]SOE73920.1 GAF domain-containing protein [Salinibacterium xinjiangense]
MDSLVHAIARPLADVWMKYSGNGWRQLPTPLDSPSVHSDGPNADRVLLMGSGIAVGFGVLSHDLALGGNLARRLAESTERGVNVDIAAKSEMSIVDAVEMYSRADLTRYDTSLLVLGDIEALQLLPVKSFRSQVRNLVRLLDSCAPHAFVLMGMAVASAGIPNPSAYARAVAERARDFVIILIEECEGLRVTPITVPIVKHGDGVVNREDYLGWASSIAPQMVSALNASACRRMSAIHGPINEDARLAALRDMGVLNDIRNPRFDDVVEMARNLFGTDTAALSFIDTDRVWIKSFAGINPGQLSRSEGVCSLTIQRSELLVIEDLSVDPRFRDRSWVRRIGSPRFYAGYWIESVDGQRVGALCLLDSKPRKFSERDHALLRKLALRIQAIAGDRERHP